MRLIFQQENNQLQSFIAQQSKDIDHLNQDMVAVGNIERSMADKINTLDEKVKTFEVKFFLYFYIL